MNLSDKLGLWADDQLQSLYFKDAPLKKLQEKFYNFFIPVCNHIECHNQGEPCWLPNWGESESEEEVILWYCYEHMHGAGFCRNCRQFWAGVEDFEFGNGLCSNCRFEEDNEEVWSAEDDYE